MPGMLVRDGQLSRTVIQSCPGVLHCPHFALHAKACRGHSIAAAITALTGSKTARKTSSQRRNAFTRSD
jgi:hypothetical protein